MNNLINKYLTLFLTGGVMYLLIEFISRDGHTHWSMGIVGGICFVLIGLINEVYSSDTPFWLQMLLGGLLVTLVELASGIIINLVLGLGVWDYSNHSLNFLGQVCLPFSILWCGISAFAIVVDDYIRYWFFGEDRPQYCFF
ncbi:MAG: hypothetical protein E7256_12615 [Lachnospiraceae bacterium]|nr:hypothetical protein [Lachnospiraceae bacterium]